MVGWTGILIVLFYFLLQYWAIRSAGRQTETKSLLSRPFIYSSSVAASGSTWLYYGSTDYAAKYGSEFIGLYIGIVLVFTLGFPLLLKIVELAKSEGIKSISDFIGARYGKSFSVAALVTLITTIGLIPYISLQMTAIHYLFDVFGGSYDPHSHGEEIDSHLLVLLMILGIGYATISYSARSTYFTDGHDGLLRALAVDTVIKFVAFLFIGIAATTFLFGPPAEVLNRVARYQADLPVRQMDVSVGNLVALVLIGASSVLLLPSQFYLTVVENRSEKELRTARWFIPLTLLIAGLFVLPLARIGPAVLGEHASADFYFLSLPLYAGQYWLGVIAFAGGLSAATTMVIFPSIILSIMISNDLLPPVLIRRSSSPTETRDFTRTIPNLRRVAMLGILLAALAYQFTIFGHVDFTRLALISATAMMQLLPPFLGGLFWRRGTARGARWGMLGGFCVWLYTMVLPTMLDMTSSLHADGPFEFAVLRPYALFGLEASNYVNGLFWSLSVNITLFIAGSHSRSATPLERIQASVFITRKRLVPECRRQSPAECDRQSAQGDNIEIHWQRTNRPRIQFLS